MLLSDFDRSVHTWPHDSTFSAALLISRAPNPGSGAQPRRRSRSPDPAGHSGHVRSRTRLALPCPAPTRRKRLAEIRVGRLREQSQGEVLPVDTGWSSATRNGDGHLGAHCRGRRVFCQSCTRGEVMTLFTRLRFLIRNLFDSGRADRALDAELQSAVDLLAADHEARGLTPAAARRAAKVELGGTVQIAEHVPTSASDMG